MIGNITIPIDELKSSPYQTSFVQEEGEFLTFQKNINIYNTEETTPSIKKKINHNNYPSEYAKIIKEIRMVITKVFDKIVQLKCDNEIFFELPKILFQNQTIIKYGQPVLYQILEKSNGGRFQRIIERNEDVSSKNQDILNLLAQIKFQE